MKIKISLFQDFLENWKLIRSTIIVSGRKKLLFQKKTNFGVPIQTVSPIYHSKFLQQKSSVATFKKKNRSLTVCVSQILTIYKTNINRNEKEWASLFSLFLKRHRLLTLACRLLLFNGESGNDLVTQKI